MSSGFECATPERHFYLESYEALVFSVDETT